ncbi:MAG: NAD(P)H-dependent oxidoreductase [Candidatus Thiothrix sulfatifontis]|nr:MAG: NAD(P)H-dependent oxidoreductase [Candidatus Thiothrix sulfatifontis]
MQPFMQAMNFRHACKKFEPTRQIAADDFQQILEFGRLSPYLNTFGWSSKQCYIALANMLTGAASMGIDSCPIEGFSKSGVEALLGVDTSQYGAAVVVAFGYRAGEQPAKLRQPLADLVEYR